MPLSTNSFLQAKFLLYLNVFLLLNKLIEDHEFW